MKALLVFSALKIRLYLLYEQYITNIIEAAEESSSGSSFSAAATSISGFFFFPSSGFHLLASFLKFLYFTIVCPLFALLGDQLKRKTNFLFWGSCFILLLFEKNEIFFIETKLGCCIMLILVINI